MTEPTPLPRHVSRAEFRLELENLRARGWRITRAYGENLPDVARSVTFVLQPTGPEHEGDPEGLLGASWYIASITPFRVSATDRRLILVLRRVPEHAPGRFEPAP